MINTASIIRRYQLEKKALWTGGPAKIKDVVKSYKAYHATKSVQKSTKPLTRDLGATGSQIMAREKELSKLQGKTTRARNVFRTNVGLKTKKGSDPHLEAATKRRAIKEQELREAASKKGKVGKGTAIAIGIGGLYVGSKLTGSTRNQPMYRLQHN